MNKTERKMYNELNPKGLLVGRLAQAADVAIRRRRHQDNAWHWLTTGESVGPLPYGRDWNRDYNPQPYPEAVPDDIDLYMGTGIGALYGIDGSESHLWQLAGWNIVRTGNEQRARRK